MKEEMFVIATRGRNNKQIYLAVDESIIDSKKVRFKWVEDVEDAYATFSYADAEYTAKNYFKNFSKWYITSYDAIFN